MTSRDIDRIIAAIDRNTEAVKRQTEWLKLDEEDPSPEILTQIREFIRPVCTIIAIGVVFLAAIAVSKATPLLPPLDQPGIVEIGTPPLSPPNSYLQYWHTQYVPGPQGVLPVEVFALRLETPMASNVVSIPEPDTGTAVLLMSSLFFFFLYLRAERDCQRAEIAMRDLRQERDALQCALWDIIATITDAEGLKRIAREALEESK